MESLSDQGIKINGKKYESNNKGMYMDIKFNTSKLNSTYSNLEKLSNTKKQISDLFKIRKITKLLLLLYSLKVFLSNEFMITDQDIND